jgi:opacity protein-like surface antigen
MMKMNKLLLFALYLTLSTTIPILAQSEGLTSSPYSLYGLGVINQTSIGRTNAMGYSGIALKSDTEINNLNPANFALTPQNSFFYDIGIRGKYNNYSNRVNDEAKTTVNFSNLSLAFRIADRLGAGIALVPYSDVGYTLIGVKTNIEGANESFQSNVNGLGGLSDFKFNLGYGITDDLRFGASFSILFGKIEEEESFQIDNSTFNSTEDTNYSGPRFGLGMQYGLTKNITLGSTVQFPTSLKGSLRRSVIKSLDGVEITVEEDENDTVDDFKMPLELGFGLSANFLKSFTINADYKKNYWNDTGQSENIGKYVDQDIYALGLEFVKNSAGYKYGQRIRYRTGFNYDTGYITKHDSKVGGQNFTVGIGLPIGQGNNSMLNLSYSYGSTGQIENILIKENYHVLTLNLSLEDLWFKKRKTD